MLEINLDLSELQNANEVQKDIVVNWNQKKLNTFLKGEFVARDRAFAREVDEIELCVFDNNASIILLYKQDDFYKSLYKKLYKGRSFLKIDFDIVNEIVILSWHTREWTIEKQKLV